MIPLRTQIRRLVDSYKSHRDFATKIGIDENYVGDYIRGKKDPGAFTLDQDLRKIGYCLVIQRIPELEPKTRLEFMQKQQANDQENR